jgi:hypothetical protein
MALNKKQKYLIGGLIVILIEIVISLFPNLKNFELKNFLETITVVVSILGIFSESNKEQEKKKDSETSTPEVFYKKVYNLNISFESGLYGGLVGGILSGSVIAVIVFLSPNHPSLNVCLKIIPYCASIGCLFGVLIYVGRTTFVRINFFNDIWANFFGCLIGCIPAGILSGMMGMWLFGYEDYEFIGYGPIALASMIGALGLIFGSLLYEYEGRLKYIILSMTVGLLLSFFISMIGFLLINDDTIAWYLAHITRRDTVGYLMKTGAILGAVDGFVFGLVIAFTIVFYKYWKFAEKQRTAALN